MKRVARNVLAFLLLGAISNVAGVWLLAIYSLPESVSGMYACATVHDTIDHAWAIDAYSSFGATKIVSLRVSDELSHAMQRTSETPDSLVPGWAEVQTQTALLRKGCGVGRTYEAFGFPIACLCSRLDYQLTVGNTPPGPALILDSHDSIQFDMQNRLNALHPTPTLLPTRALAVPFIFNTIFYAAILWLPFAMIGVARRRRRAHRGLCTACGYDLRGSPNKLCPECGVSASNQS